MYTPLNAQRCPIFTIQSDRVPIRSHKAAQLLDKIPSITPTPPLHLPLPLDTDIHTQYLHLTLFSQCIFIHIACFLCVVYYKWAYLLY